MEDDPRSDYQTSEEELQLEPAQAQAPAPAPELEPQPEQEPDPLEGACVPPTKAPNPSAPLLREGQSVACIAGTRTADYGLAATVTS